MGRTFPSVRLVINAMAERWMRASRGLRPDYRRPGRCVAESAKTYASEAFMGCNTGMEGAVFSILVTFNKKTTGGPNAPPEVRERDPPDT